MRLQPRSVVGEDKRDMGGERTGRPAKRQDPEAAFTGECDVSRGFGLPKYLIWMNRFRSFATSGCWIDAEFCPRPENSCSGYNFMDL